MLLELNKNSIIKQKDKEAGISLIEVSIFIVVLSLLLFPLLKVIEIERAELHSKRQNGKVSDLKTALMNYALEHGAYPMPAGPTLAKTNTNVFMPVTGGGIPTNCTDSGAAGSTGVICRPREHTNTNIEQQVYVGAVPVSVLGLRSEEGLDEYGNKFTYAVTRILTTRATFVDTTTRVVKDGAIIIEDGSGTAALENAHFVVVSHGINGNGGFDANGNLIGGTACPSTGEGQNAWQCNSGGSQAAGRYRSFFGSDGNKSKAKSYGTTAGSYFDDYIEYSDTVFGNKLWASRQETVATSYFAQKGQVGIGYQDNVVGPNNAVSMRTGNAIVQGNAEVGSLCNSTNCAFKPGDVAAPLAEATVYCPNNMGLKQIVGNSGKLVQTCYTDPVVTDPMPSCIAVGIDAAGGIICK